MYRPLCKSIVMAKQEVENYILHLHIIHLFSICMKNKPIGILTSTPSKHWAVTFGLMFSKKSDILLNGYLTSIDLGDQFKFS